MLLEDLCVLGHCHPAAEQSKGEGPLYPSAERKFSGKQKQKKLSYFLNDKIKLKETIPRL